ncbi:hypothetical protein [Calothrix sp. FACHB-1219]|uniref:hypothetical protein n=1 Tax=Calothrix sp. FACHB-1219 TaxID=2692778 RepID=UPI0030DCC40F
MNFNHRDKFDLKIRITAVIEIIKTKIVKKKLLNKPPLSEYLEFADNQIKDIKDIKPNIDSMYM